jgi:hypothetical protein
MKPFLISLLVGIFVQTANANSAEMQIVMNAQSGSFFAGALPIGFTSKELLSGTGGDTIIPKISNDLMNTLTQLETKEKLNWIDYVTSSPWEFVDCPDSSLDDEDELAKECYQKFQTELDVIALNPEQFLGRALIELEHFHAIYKNKVLVGYVIEFSNHVDAAIIQDGSGIVIYLDADMNVLQIDEWQS